MHRRTGEDLAAAVAAGLPLTTREAAAVLGVSKKALETLRRRGDGPPCYRPGVAATAWRYRPTDLQAWVDARIETDRAALEQARASDADDSVKAKADAIRRKIVA